MPSSRILLTHLLLLSFLYLFLASNAQARISQISMSFDKKQSTEDITFNTFSSTPIAESKQALSELERDVDLAARVKRISVVSHYDGEPYSGDRDKSRRKFYESLAKTLSKGPSHFTQFENLTWDYAGEVPKSLLKALETRYSHASLILNTHSSFLPSSALKAVSVYLHSGELSKDKKLFRRVQRGIQGSKNLRRLDLHIGTGGCILYNYNTEFSNKERGKFPPLEEIKLGGFSPSARDAEYWMKNMDWSHLRILELGYNIDSSELMKALVPVAEHTPALAKFSITLPSFGDDASRDAFASLLTSFFSSAHKETLTEIEIYGEYQPFIEHILHTFGSSLKRLTLHKPERADDSQRPILTPDQMSDIVTQSSELEHLGIDINMSPDHTWPLHILDTILSEERLPNLRSLTLSSLLGIRNYNPFNPVNFDEIATPEEHKALISQLSSRASLQELDVFIGEHRREIGGGYPAAWVSWEQEHAQHWTACRNGNGDLRVDQNI